MIKRREFIERSVFGGLAGALLPRIALGQTPSSSRFVFVLLRGGLDGLAAIIPRGDPAYRNLRAGMAFDPDGLTPLDGDFALAPGLAPLEAFWDRGELVALHAMAIPYRTRSHFDGQAILETGLDRPSGDADGWLNRLLQVMDGESSGIAVAAGLPRSMSGSYQVTTWSPANLGAVDDDYLERLHFLYRQDPLLANAFEAALQLQATGADMAGGTMRSRGGGRGAVAPTLAAAARFLAEPDGPNIAAVEFSGWDTHANQGMAGGALDRLLNQLAVGLETFRNAMGDAWTRTTVVVMTEFGRTARPNGTGGTDHGTASVGFVVGPTVAGARVLADWPGLGDRYLFEGRDLAPTLDTREILKSVVMGSMDLTRAQANRVFPGSDAVPTRADLMG